MATKRSVFGTNNKEQRRQFTPISYDEVARVAYSLYEQRGRSDGRDWEDWLQAEAIVRSRRA